ncbi:MAG: hypothetical protein KF823_11275 [Xanthomonadales bacterium]|nr:hypothetical protein [Xanthomonadales bacterium]
MIRNIRLALRIVFIVLLTSATTAVAGPGLWTSAGPQGGSLSELVVDPANPARVIVNGGDAVHRSTDAGLNWSRVEIAPYTGFLTRLQADAANADHLLALGGGRRIYRSLDHGLTWTQLAGTGLPADEALAELIMDRHVAGRVWASSQSGLWRSTDGGETWSAFATSGLAGRAIEALAFDPHVPGRLFAQTFDLVGGSRALMRSTDGGASWGEPAVAGLSNPQYCRRTCTAFTTVPGDILLAGNGDEVFRSNDGGASFLSTGVVSLANSRPIRRIVPHPSLASTWYVLMESGLARTGDGGASYTAVGQGIRPTAGPWNNGVADLHVVATAPATLYAAADYTGFFASSDAGVSWSRRINGLRQAQVRAVAVHPTQPLWLYAGYGDAFSTPSDGLFQSLDRGASWFSASGSLEASGLRAIAIDPNTAASPFSTVIYAAGYGSPVFALGGGIRDGNAGIYKSTNGGATWSTIDAGIPTLPAAGYQISAFSTARSIVLDPSSGGPPGGTGPLQVAYLGGSGRISYHSGTGVPTVLAARIWKSTDAGASWTASDTGLPVPDYDTSLNFAATVQVVQLAIDPVDPATLYASTFTGFPEPGGPAFPEPLESQGVLNGVFKSTDAGATWVHSSNGLPRGLPANPDSAVRSVLALALAPSSPNVLYAAVNRNTFDARIYKSVDGGASWTEANTGIAPDADIRALLVDPLDANVAYAGSAGTDGNPGGVYRTLDGGLTWTSYSVGLPGSSALALALDRSAAIPRLYAGTREGVFSIDQVPDEDLDGAPSAVEAGAPNGGDGNGDGVPDTLQPRVASMPGAGTGRGGDAYLTVQLEPLAGACVRLENAHALPATAFPADPGHSYPWGLVRMDLSGCTQARLHVTWHGGTDGPGWQLRTFAPEDPADPYGYAWRALPASREGSVWVVELTDNTTGDLRPTAGAMLVQFGAGYSEAIFANGFE